MPMPSLQTIQPLLSSPMVLQLETQELIFGLPSADGRISSSARSSGPLRSGCGLIADAAAEACCPDSLDQKKARVVGLMNLVDDLGIPRHTDDVRGWVDPRLKVLGERG